MVDLAQAFSELKSLPDTALQKELASPSGMLPGFMVLGELHERKAMRARTGSPDETIKRKSMAEEYMGDIKERMPLTMQGLQPPQAMPPQAVPPPQQTTPAGGGIASIPPPQGFAGGGLAFLQPPERMQTMEDYWARMQGQPPDEYANGGIVRLGKSNGGAGYADGGIVYRNQQAIRNQMLTRQMEAQLQDAVRAVYGPGFTLGVFSGGQPSSGGNRTGSHRHDEGRGADVHVFDPTGKKLTGNALAPLGQYWAARKYGGVGMEMKGGGVHLDEWKTPPKGGSMSWSYGKQTPQQKAAIQAGLQGQLPQQLYGAGTGGGIADVIGFGGQQQGGGVGVGQPGGGGQLTPYQMALVRTIYGPESAGRYNVMYGGGQFDTSGGWAHPNKAIPITSGPNKGKTSSAAGAGQFLGSTWEDISKRYGLKDFSPANQDLATYYLAREQYGPNLDAVLQSGDPNAIAGIGRALSKTWTSLPGGIEQGIGADRFVNAYNTALSNPQTGTMLEATVGAATNPQAQMQMAENAMGKGGGGDALSQLASLQMMGSLFAPPAPPPAAAMAAPAKPKQPFDYMVAAEETSQNPEFYRRKRQRYG